LFEATLCATGIGLSARDIFAIPNDRCGAAVCGENEMYKERGEGPFKQVTTIVPFTEGS